MTVNQDMKINYSHVEQRALWYTHQALENILLNIFIAIIP